MCIYSVRMDKITEYLKKEPWVNIWAGSWSLHTCSYWAEMYVDTLRLYEKSFVTSALFVCHEGKSAAYIPEGDRTAIRTYLADHAIEDPSRISAVCRALEQEADRILAFIDAHIGKKISKETYEAYWRMHLTYYISHVHVKYVVDALPDAILETYLPMFEKARVYAEPVFTRTEDFSRSLAEIVGDTYGYPPYLILQTLKGEFERYFDDSPFPNKEILEARFHAAALFVNQNILEIASGRDVVLIDEALKERFAGRKLAGMSAYPGVVRGIARIILDPSHASHFSSGDILISGMTRPDFLPLMKQAAAFVTDSGGILCHAAIVAREMKKPCVIGTEWATKFFQDGDMVEVDAEHGIVKKI